MTTQTEVLFRAIMAYASRVAAALPEPCSAKDEVDAVEEIAEFAANLVGHEKVAVPNLDLVFLETGFSVEAVALATIRKATITIGCAYRPADDMLNDAYVTGQKLVNHAQQLKLLPRD